MSVIREIAFQGNNVLMKIYRLWSLVLITMLTGCGGGLPLASVKGVVTLDEKPLDQATVSFQPVSEKASTSIGETDSDGEFELSYTRDKKGALVGKHKVRVNTSKVKTDPSGNETHIVEKVPDHYNSNTKLEYEVKPGSNSFEIKLRSDGPITTVTNPEFAPVRQKKPGDC